MTQCRVNIITHDQVVNGITLNGEESSSTPNSIRKVMRQFFREDDLLPHEKNQPDVCHGLSFNTLVVRSTYDTCDLNLFNSMRDRAPHLYLDLLTV